MQRSQGLFSFDNSPEDGPALAVNNALIDGNLIASAGIDIGLGGDESVLTNIGVDLGLAVDVDGHHGDPEEAPEVLVRKALAFFN